MIASSLVVCIGDNTIDRYVDPVGRDLVGGSCVNVAVALARHRVPTAYIGPVGNDVDGARVRAVVGAAGVDVSHIASCEAGQTALTEIQLLGNGERRFLSESYEIFDAYQPDVSAWAAIGGARHVHTSRLPHLFDRLRAATAENGASLSCDFSTFERPSDLRGLDLAFCSVGNRRERPFALAVALETLDRGASAAVVTLGTEGSVALTADGAAWQHAVDIEPVVDTCGAGDAFIAAYLERRLAEAAVADCLAAGALAGALACTAIGALPQHGDAVLQRAR